MTEPLTPVERRVYQYLIDFLAENTYQPSIREIGKKFRIKSTKTVSDLLHSLTAKGYIQRDPSRSRGVRILGYQGPTRVQPVPYYGKIHAGEPTLLPSTARGASRSTAASWPATTRSSCG
jgi:repressor LexA